MLSMALGRVGDTVFVSICLCDRTFDIHEKIEKGSRRQRNSDQVCSTVFYRVLPPFV